MGRIVGGTAATPIVRLMFGDAKPHQRCDPQSWCQPPEVALAAFHAAQILPPRRP